MDCLKALFTAGFLSLEIGSVPRISVLQLWLPVLLAPNQSSRVHSYCAEVLYRLVSTPHALTLQGTYPAVYVSYSPTLEA